MQPSPDMQATGVERARLARDAYSYLRLPMVAGIASPGPRSGTRNSRTEAVKSYGSWGSKDLAECC
jgi:hypothetical protein